MGTSLKELNRVSSDHLMKFRSRVGNRAGFTLLEMITILLLVSILSVAIIPRFFDKQFYSSRGFYDQVHSVLRVAQKTAISQRRNVCVQFTATSISLNIADLAGNNAVCATALAGQNGTTPYTVNAPSGVNFTDTSGTNAIPTAFNFTALGQATLGQTFRISGLTQNVTIEQETGYVHP